MNYLGFVGIVDNAESTTVDTVSFNLIQAKTLLEKAIV
jgi:hypothetical protein